MWTLCMNYSSWRGIANACMSCVIWVSHATKHSKGHKEAFSPHHWPCRSKSSGVCHLCSCGGLHENTKQSQLCLHRLAMLMTDITSLRYMEIFLFFPLLWHKCITETKVMQCANVLHNSMSQNVSVHEGGSNHRRSSSWHESLSQQTQLFDIQHFSCLVPREGRVAR